MPDLFPDNIVTVLDRLQDAMTDPTTAPRTDAELVERFHQYVQDGNPDTPTKVYVPDPDSPVTPATKNEQILGPFLPFSDEVKSISRRAKAVAADLTALIAEAQTLDAGIQQSLAAAAAKTDALKTLTASSSLSWMTHVDRFLTLEGVDSSSSNNVDVGVKAGSGITLAPISEQDLSGTVTISVVQSKSHHALPGDNLELSAIQSSAAGLTPAGGSGNALAAAKTAVTSSGGSGLEPTVSYSGDPDPHNKPVVLLSDNTDSYLDLEAIYVPPVQPCVLRGTAYVAEESGAPTTVRVVTKNLGWDAQVQFGDAAAQDTPLVQFSNPPTAGADGATAALAASFSLDMGQAVPLTELEITVRQVGGLWPTISSVSASLDQSNWYPLTTQGGAKTWQGDAAASAATTSAINAGGNTVAASGGSVRALSTWQIPSYAALDPTGEMPTFRYLSVEMRQPDSYVCPKGIGHPYFVAVSKTTKDSKSLFGLVHSHSESTDTIRYATATPLLTMPVGSGSNSSNQPGKQIGQVLGAVADVLPTSVLGNTLSSLGGIAGGVGNLVSGFVSGLIGGSSKKTEVLQSGQYTDIFSAHRQCISVGRIKPLSRVYPVGQSGQLVTNSFGFDHTFTAIRLLVDQRLPAGTKITYDISVDNGAWMPITPLDLGQPASASLTADPTVTLDLGKSYQTCRVRATLSSTKAHATARWMGFALQALPAV